MDPKSKYRKIRVVEVEDGIMFRLSNVTTGEIFLCADVAVLLRYIAADPKSEWKWEHETTEVF